MLACAGVIWVLNRGLKPLVDALPSSQERVEFSDAESGWVAGVAIAGSLPAILTAVWGLYEGWGGGRCALIAVGGTAFSIWAGVWAGRGIVWLKRRFPR